ncbi:hypothetical protein ACJMK2_029182 [Sinanodonta woodiana]|uniref:Uncharacterized protein n=1 Tax=Sinanodonta woodiana TaxID=1069815 RepID=A0ABD3X9D9_SINWO
MVKKIWYKDLWRELKKQAKKITDSKADADSSLYKSMSDEKQMIFHKSPIRSIKTPTKKRPSNSTRHELEEHFVSDNIIRFSSPERVMIVSKEKVLYSKKVPTRDVLSHFSSPKQLTKTVADQRTFDSCGTRRPLDSTGNNNVSNKNLAFQSSKGVAVSYGQKGDKYDKTEPSVQASIILEADFMFGNPLTPDGSSYASIPNQNTGKEENIDTLIQENDKVVQEMEDCLDYVSSFPDIALSDKTGKKSKYNLAEMAFLERTGEKSIENREDTRLLYEQILFMLSNDQITVTSASRLYVFPQTLRTGGAELLRFSSVCNLDFKNTGNGENKDTHGQRKDNVDEEKKDCLDYVSFFPDIALSDKTGKKSKYSLADLKFLVGIITASEKTGEKPVEYSLAKMAFLERTGEKSIENREDTRLLYEQILSMLSNDQNRYKEEWYIARKNKYELKEKVVGNRQGNGKHLVTSAKLHTPSTQDQIQDQGREATRWIFEQILSVLPDYWRQRSNRASEDSADQPTHHTDSCSDDNHTTCDSQEDNNTIMPVCMKNENWSKVQAAKILSSEANTDASSVKPLSTRIRLYRNVIRNETYRMMSSINMVLTEAEQLFGPERSQILFDLLTTELCHFGSTGAIFEFVPNMTKSTIRKTVISFFEHARDMMNILMTLFLSCPDGLQQMQVHDFISVMKPIIKSLLKTKTKGREKLTLKEKIKTVFDSEGFEIELGEEILKDFFNRYLNGEEKVVHSCTRLERHLPSDRRENRPILSIYFPSDCRLFIYIPTENGSYWHQLDMQRSDRISRHGK